MRHALTLLLLIFAALATAAPKLKDKPKELDYDPDALNSSVTFFLGLPEGAQDHDDFPSLEKLMKELGLSSPKRRPLDDFSVLVHRERATALLDAEWGMLRTHPMVKSLKPYDLDRPKAKDKK
jgi:hypothetical protein